VSSFCVYPIISFTIEGADRIELGVELDYTDGGDKMLALSGTLVSVLNTVQTFVLDLNKKFAASQPNVFASQVDETVFYLFQVHSSF
jgi:hypothetical protein